MDSHEKVPEATKISETICERHNAAVYADSGTVHQAESNFTKIKNSTMLQWKIVPLDLKMWKVKKLKSAKTMHAVANGLEISVLAIQQKKDIFRRQGEGCRIGLGDKILAALAVLSGSF